VSIFDTEGVISTPQKPSTDLIKAIGTRFISRKDVKAEQGKDGAWHPVRVDPRDTSSATIPFVMQDFVDHLQGTRTLGHYVVGTDDTAKFFCLDLDLDKEGFYMGPGNPESDPEDLAARVGHAIKAMPREIWAAGEPADAMEYYTVALRCLAEGLGLRAAKLIPGMHIAIANSGGKGLHVYGFMPSGEPTPAGIVREMAEAVLMDIPNQFAKVKGDNFWKANTSGAYSNITIEVFPKQTALSEGGYGNLIRLPLGINRKTGNRGYFVNCKSGYNKLPEMDALRALTGDFPWE
jgi:hypothetical protein